MIVNVIDREGAEHVLEAPEGWRLMEVIRDHDLPIKAECGGCCSCATCHVYVDEDWLDRIPEKRDEEEDMLDMAYDLTRTSRLGCQVVLNDGLDGIVVNLPSAHHNLMD